MTERLLVRGGTVVTPRGRYRGDVLVEDGRITALGEPGAFGSADVVLDADGLFVLPGLVDAHVHVRDPGFTHKEDFGSATRAAAAGGVTTILVMPYDQPLASTAQSLTDNARGALGRAFVDFGLQGAVGPANMAAIPELVAAGAVSLEVQLAEAAPLVGLPSAADLREILTLARASGAVVGVYCEDESLRLSATRRLQAAGRRDPLAHIESKIPFGEELAALLACTLARDTGAELHLRQISTAAALDVARRARLDGARVSVEVTPHHLSLTAEDEVRGGPAMKVSPPLREPADAAALRAGVADGTVDIVATDHAPHAPEEKAAGEHDIWAAPGGFPGLETLLSALVALFGADAPEVIARVCADAPARRFGLGDRKGRIAPGFDADLVLLDLDATWEVIPKALHTRAASSPFAGRRLPGVVRSTLVAGCVVAQDRAIVGEPRGRWLRPVGRAEGGAA